MRLATINTEAGTIAARIDGDQFVATGHNDVTDLLSHSDWPNLAASAAGPAVPLAEASFAPPIPRPGKVICVGLNYRSHIIEMKRPLPEFPTLFAKYPEALIGADDVIELSTLSTRWDWEAELAIVIGRPSFRVSAHEAAAAIAGFSIINDVTARDFQSRTPQWLQGKTFFRTAPFGPALVTPDELDGGVRPQVTIRCSVNGQVVQDANTADLVFDPVSLIEYIARIVPLMPGDVIASGTPGGVGHASDPPRYLAQGDTLVTEITGIGLLTNVAQVR